MLKNNIKIFSHSQNVTLKRRLCLLYRCAMWTRNDSPNQKFFFWEFQWYSKFRWVLVGLFLCARFVAFGRVGVCDLTFSFFLLFSFLSLSLAQVKLTPRVCLLLLNCFMVIENVSLKECVRKLNSLIVNRCCCNYSQLNFGRFFLSRHHHQHSLFYSLVVCVAISTSTWICDLRSLRSVHTHIHTWKDALKMNAKYLAIKNDY